MQGPAGMRLLRVAWGHGGHASPVAVSECADPVYQADLEKHVATTVVVLAHQVLSKIWIDANLGVTSP